MRTQKGITLVALVITIIVLLILAGVSISMALGDNGILSRAESSVEESDIASEMERIRLAMYAYELDKYQTIKEYTNLADAIEKEAGMTASGSGDTLTVTGDKDTYTVTVSTGEIVSSKGFSLKGTGTATDPDATIS